MPWYRSQRFIALCQATILLVLVWIIQALTLGDWTRWRPLLVVLLTNLYVALNDWWSPFIKAPAMGFLGPLAPNKSNASIKAFKEP